MPATPNLALPYPVATDPADIPRDVKALADRLDIVAGGGAVTGLPGSPADGQEVYYVADAANGIIWHLRYRAAAASSHKWEYIGGPPLRAFIAAAEGAPVGVANAYSDATTIGPTVVAPLAGDYDIRLEATMQHNAANTTIYMSFANGAVTAVDVDSISIYGNTSSIRASVARTILARSIAAGATVRAKYRTDSAAIGGVENRGLILTPVRVG